MNPNSDNLNVWLLDRFYYQVFLGVDLSRNFMPYFDRFDISLGLLGSSERKRLHTGLEPFFTNMGLDLGLRYNYKGFGIENSLYYGAKQMQFFREYGEVIYSGLPFYHANFYDRLEAYWEHRNTYCTARFSFIFHFTESIIANQQMLSIVIDTDKLLRKVF